jgi:Peptidogalycan biosysnthesis/recognition
MMRVIYKKNVEAAESMESCILKMLTYFSIFEYPLLKDEIRRFLPPVADAVSFEKALAKLAEERSIFKIDKLYLLQDNIALVKRRKEGNLRAERLLVKAMKIGKFLSKFPYVRGIAVSGSLSKMYAGEKADIDFFIITKANRLWIARTFMHLFKKLTYLTGKQHFYCMNYYLDEKALKLRDQNIYTAVETTTLLPVCGESMHEFFAANNWVSEWFAGYSSMIKNQQPHTNRSWIKKAIEWLFNNNAGNRLDDYLMKLTSRRWKKKQEKKMLNSEGKEMALITGKHFAWSNPDSFQEKVIGFYNKKIAEMKLRWPEYFETVNASFEE